jgi:hypothetical protein
VRDRVFCHDDERLVSTCRAARPNRPAPPAHLRRVGERGLFEGPAWHLEDRFADSVPYNGW